MYTCSRCNNQKEEIEFNRDKKKKSGYASACKVCEKARVKKWNEENIEKRKEQNSRAAKKYRETFKSLSEEEKKEKFKYIVIPEQRVCYNCKKEQSITEFYKNRNIASGYDYECRTCKKEHHKEWVKNNPEIIKEYDKQRYHNNKEGNKERAKHWYEENKEKVKIRQKEQRELNPEKAKIQDRKNKLKTKYNTTPELVEELRIKQENRCAICANEFTGTPYIDHCHKTEIVRGLLCHSCNVSIGLLKENSETLSNAIKYLAQQ